MPSADDGQRTARHIAHYQTELGPRAWSAGEARLHSPAAGRAGPPATPPRIDAERTRPRTPAVGAAAGSDSHSLSASRHRGGRGVPHRVAGDHCRRRRPPPLREPIGDALRSDLPYFRRVTSQPEPHLPEPHLLVVDDDARLRELLRRYLSDSGFRVTTAGDTWEARSNLASFAFDLVVLDVMMPGESGLELTRALRGEGRVPVLLLTAMGEPEDRVNGLEQGADDYLSKPFEPRELVLRIRNILQRRLSAAQATVEIRFGNFRFDPSRAELFRSGDTVH